MTARKLAFLEKKGSQDITSLEVSYQSMDEQTAADNDCCVKLRATIISNVIFLQSIWTENDFKGCYCFARLMGCTIQFRLAEL